MKKPLLALAATTVACLLAAPAHADEPYTHDGFQFRFVVGPSYLSDSESYSTGSTSATIAGGGASLEFYLGGSPIPGLTIGGFLSGTSAVNPTVSVGGTTLGSANGASVGIGQIGPYLDFYPDPKGGFHALGGFALATLTVNNGQGTSTQSGSGYGINLGAGYDWWVGRSVSLGVLARFTYARTTLSQTEAVESPLGGGEGTVGVVETVNVTDSIIAPSLLFSVTYQ